MRVVIDPLPALGDLVAPKLRKSGRPVRNDARFDQRFEKLLKSLRPRGKELRAVVELEGAGTAGSHPPTDAPGFLEQNDVIRLLEPARHHETRKPGTNDRDR